MEIYRDALNVMPGTQFRLPLIRMESKYKIGADGAGAFVEKPKTSGNE